MSSEYGKRSAAEMRSAQREMLSRAETAVPAVVVTEKNWTALIESQKVQIRTLGEIMEKLDTLTTDKQLVAYMNKQLEILRQDSQDSMDTMEQYRQTMMQEAKATTEQTQKMMKSMEQQAGKLNEQFGKALSQTEQQTKNTSKVLFLISTIPSLFLVLWELIRHIWLLN